MERRAFLAGGILGVGAGLFIASLLWDRRCSTQRAEIERLLAQKNRLEEDVRELEKKSRLRGGRR